MKTKIPAVVTAYLKRAPKVPGHRILKPTEKAKPGDIWYYLRPFDGPYTAISLSDGFHSCVLASGAGDTGYIRIGRTLLEARQHAIKCEYRLYTAKTFCGVIYRPLKK